MPLEDIASVSLDQKERINESYINGAPALNLSIQKMSNANTVEVCKEIRHELERLKETYEEIDFSVIYDSSKYIELSLNTVTESAIQGNSGRSYSLFILKKYSCNLDNCCVYTCINNKLLSMDVLFRN